MRTSIGCGVVLLSVLGNVTEASGVSDAVLAGNRGLSPIISIGVCQLIDGADKPPSAFNVMTPSGSAWSYLRRVAKLTTQVTDEMLVTAKVTLLEGAKHGELKVTPSGNYRFYPEQGYLGTDQATFLVEMGNYSVKVIYHFKVGGEFGANDAYDSYNDKKNCPNGRVWKISTIQDANVWK